MGAHSDDPDNEVAAREELQKYCDGMKENLQLLTSSVALLGHLCTEAASAHEALHSQVLGLGEDLQGSEHQPSGSAAAPPAALGHDVRDSLASTLDVEARMLAAGSSLTATLARLEQWRGRSAAARAAAEILSPPRMHLLDLPDNVVDIIAKLMGKRARLLCSKLCQVYGSPGAGLRLPNGLHAGTSASRFAPYAAILRAWRHPIRQLDLPSGITLDNPACATIAECLPQLGELRCSLLDLDLDPPAPPAPGPHAASAHTALTRLQAGWMLGVCSDAAAFAPHLRALEVRAPDYEMHYYYAVSAPDTRALASLTELRSLDVPLPVKHIAPASSGLSATLRCLTSLTHLGLDLVETGRYYDAIDPAPVPAADAAGFAAALEALPQLASLKIAGFGRLGPPLGQALQRMGALRWLELSQQPGARSWSPPRMIGCAPDVSAMPGLEGLEIAGARALPGRELLRVCGPGGAAALRALRLLDMDCRALGAAADALARLPALTRLAVSFAGCYWHEEHERLFFQEVPRLAHLRDLEVRGHIKGFDACLAGLAALTRFSSAGLRAKTSLRAAFAQSAWVALALQALSALGGLREVALHGVWVEEEHLGRCVEAVRRLPLLERLELGRAAWEEGDVGLLLPPPERLRRLVLAWGERLGTEPWRFEAAASVQRLESYGVDVTVRAC